MGMLAASPVVSRGFRIARSVAWHGVLLHVAVAACLAGERPPSIATTAETATTVETAPVAGPGVGRLKREPPPTFGPGTLTIDRVLVWRGERKGAIVFVTRPGAPEGDARASYILVPSATRAFRDLLRDLGFERAAVDAYLQQPVFELERATCLALAATPQICIDMRLRSRHGIDAQGQRQEELVLLADDTRRQLVDAIPLPLMVTSIPHHRVLHANQAAHGWQGGLELDPWVGGMSAQARSRFFQRLSDLGAIDEFEVSWGGGGTRTCALISARLIDYQGQRAVLSTFTPINKTKLMESRLELWAKVFEASAESLIVMDADMRIVTVNLAFRRHSQYDMVELIGKRPAFLLAPDNPPEQIDNLRQTLARRGYWQGEISVQRKSMESYPAWLVMNAVRDLDGVTTHFIASSLDISERKASERQIEHMAHHDALTGLANRHVSKLRLAAAIAQARRSGEKVGVLFVDLDRFKHVNDALGHHVGDALLQSVSARLLQLVREGDTVSRLGGDEFVIILNGIGDAAAIGDLLDDRLIPAMRQPHQVEGSELYVSCSVGVAIYPDHGADMDTLMRHADTAMYQAKSGGRDHARMFTPRMEEQQLQQLHLESDLRHAIERDELVLYYQPRVDAKNSRLNGVESLLRWQHPQRGLIAPDNFIPAAEESGLIVPIGAWVIREACRQHVAWREAGAGDIAVSVNLSAIQLKHGGLLATLREVLREFPIAPGLIEFELTESILMENVGDTIATLHAIKALGFALSIDDFGTGYSSLNYLCRFPLDKLKIDMSFVQNIHNSPQNLAVTKAIIGLGHTLGLTVTAEGVESAADAEVLRQAGCDELQGFYFARPMPHGQLAAWLAQDCTA